MPPQVDAARVRSLVSQAAGKLELDERLWKLPKFAHLPKEILKALEEATVAMRAVVMQREPPAVRTTVRKKPRKA